MRRREEEERILGLMGSCVSLSFAEGAQCPPAGDPDVWRCGIRHPHQDVHCEFSALHFSIGLVSQPHQGTPVFVAPLACCDGFPHPSQESLQQNLSAEPGLPSRLLLCALARAVLLPSTCSGAELSLPGCSIYLLLSSLQVAKELLQEICEQMGAGEQEEMQEFALFAIRKASDKNGK